MFYVKTAHCTGNLAPRLAPKTCHKTRSEDSCELPKRPQVSELWLHEADASQASG